MSASAELDKILVRLKDLCCEFKVSGPMTFVNLQIRGEAARQSGYQALRSAEPENLYEVHQLLTRCRADFKPAFEQLIEQMAETPSDLARSAWILAIAVRFWNQDRSETVIERDCIGRHLTFIAKESPPLSLSKEEQLLFSPEPLSRERLYNLYLHTQSLDAERQKLLAQWVWFTDTCTFFRSHGITLPR
jgi:hypothetical protein